jgi:hypothetical protein
VDGFERCGLQPISKPIGMHLGFSPRGGSRRDQNSILWHCDEAAPGRNKNASSTKEIMILRVVLTQPCDKNKNVVRMGHRQLDIMKTQKLLISQ